MKLFMKAKIVAQHATKAALTAQAVKPEEATEVATVTDMGDSAGSFRVILFNDEEHTFEEVIQQLMIALSCTRSKAERLTWVVHTRGRCMVFAGSLEEALQVSAVLEEIALRTEIQSVG